MVVVVLHSVVGWFVGLLVMMIDDDGSWHVLPVIGYSAVGSVAIADGQ